MQPSRSTARASVLLIASLAPIGCWSTTAVPARETRALAPQQETAFVLRDTSGSPVKLDPNSELAFRRTDGTTTCFIVASDLLVNEDGVFVKPEAGNGDTTAIDGLKWSDVSAVEVKNLEAGETFVAVVAITAAVVGLIAILSASKGKLDLPRLNVHVSSNGGGSSGGGGGGGGYGETVPVDTHKLAKDGYTPPRADHEQPLFTAEEQRKSVLQPIAAFDAASDFAVNGQRQSSLGVGVRLYDFVELGGGLRWLDPAYGPESHGNLLGFFRAGMHAELDSGRRIAIVMGFAYGGGGEARGHFKLDWGVRIRATDSWWFGAFFLNPTWTRYADGAHPELTKKWSFPSGIETSVTF